MPHRSRLSILLPDLPPEHHAAGTRLEALGATRHRFVEEGAFWQLLDPSGMVFCVVGIQTGDEVERHAGTSP